MKMTEQEFFDAFRELFAGFFAELGFSQTGDIQFTRQKADAEHRVSFAASQDKQGVFRLSCGVGVRFPKIEAIVRPGGDAERISTVGMPLHLLRPDKEYRPWPFASRRDLEALKSNIIADLREYALPFFAAHGDYASVLTSLRSESPKDWFMTTSDSRDALLVADALLNLGQAEALKFGEALLEKYDGRMPKYSQTLRDVLGRIRTQAV